MLVVQKTCNVTLLVFGLNVFTLIVCIDYNHTIHDFEQSR